MEQLTSILIGAGVLLIGLLVGLFLRRQKKYNDQIRENKVEEVIEEVVNEEEALEEVVSAKSEKRLKPKPKKVEDEDEGSSISIDFIGLIPKIAVLLIVIVVGLNILGAVCTALVNDSTSSSIDSGLMCTDKGNPKVMLWVPFVLVGFIAAFGMRSIWRNDAI